jgi:hypothetical protein
MYVKISIVEDLYTFSMKINEFSPKFSLIYTQVLFNETIDVSYIIDLLNGWICLKNDMMLYLI